jgi:multisubunit Na+/H+ antiporter MnhB subunit
MSLTKLPFWRSQRSSTVVDQGAALAHDKRREKTGLQMKILRIALAAVLMIAAALAFIAQRDGGGALAAQIVYMVALALLCADRFVMVRKERLTNGRALLQVGLGLLILSLLFSPDFGNVMRRKTSGLTIQKIAALCASGNPDMRLMALEICLRRRAFKACSDGFAAAATSDDPTLRSLGAAGLRGRSGMRR